MRRGVLVFVLLLAVGPAAAAEFRQLKGPDIQAGIIGMTLTDHVHWRYTFQRDGSLPSTALGRDRVGSWRVEGDRLCTTQGLGVAECHTVWIAGRRVQLRPDNDAFPIEEGTLERP